MRAFFITLGLCVLAAAVAAQRVAELDEGPAGPSEWGYRPADGAVSAVNPPAFSWRPMRRKIVGWELEVARDAGFHDVVYRAEKLPWSAHCPPVTWSPGEYHWRYRGAVRGGATTGWSKLRRFRLTDHAVAMPLPPREELLARIPDGHPRLFLRPEGLPKLRELAGGRLAKPFAGLVKQCDRLLKSPPPTAEPPRYPRGTKSGSDPWRKIWWGNRTYTIRALEGAATLAFVAKIGGEAKYADAARRILMACAAWDPRGATGYRYNDEAGMPYAYHFARTYTLLRDRLSEEELARCRRVMRLRGRDMYRHLCPGHLWRPYSSHSNRAWHFLGEVGVAFHGEIPEAGDWVWFAANVFAGTYPVWSDDDGGWHEGSAYWASYLGRFTWWADVMRTSLGIDAYRKPFFAKVGDFALYLMPPKKLGGGFGDLTARRRARDNARLMTTFATQAGNPYWQWYVEQIGGPKPAPGYIGFLRGALPRVEAKAPTDLPASRLFRGTGQAVLNTSLTDASKSVQVVFKSSPFGTQSHGYEANNAFLLWAHGERLLIRTGRRDSYGSDHHRRWMWSTRSVNAITVGGTGQLKRSARARGGITAFQTTPAIDVVAGEAATAYVDRSPVREQRLLDRCTRTVVFVKPDFVLIHDRITARVPTTVTTWLHAVNKIELEGTRRFRIRAGDVVCDGEIFAPEPLAFTQTNDYDPNPRPRVKLREWHLAASTKTPRKSIDLVMLLWPKRPGDKKSYLAEMLRGEEGIGVNARVPGGTVKVLIKAPGQARLKSFLGLDTQRSLLVQRNYRDGRAPVTLELDIPTRR